MRRRRYVEAYSLSFLDCICCGFGAIILLLVLSKIYEPVIIEKTQDDLESLIARLQQELFEIRGETIQLDRQLESVREQTSDTKINLARLHGELNTVRGQYRMARTDEEQIVDETELQIAKQRLTDEMKRLQPYFRRAEDDAIAGVPVDSEYVIFIIDTSGSMQAYNWDRVIRKVNEVLDVYPEVKGMQILNDNGKYMFQQYAGEWIPDTPGRRQAVVNTMRSWRPFSDSNPVDGIIYAISKYWTPNRKISVYVFGDDFQGGSIDQVVEQIDRVNQLGSGGERMVRIHAIGFPSFHAYGGGYPLSVARFATLMRVLCDRNGGTFVALAR